MLETRQVANMQTVPLKVRVSTFDFDMTPDDKDDLYRDGWTGAIEYFYKYVGPRPREEIESLLRLYHSHLKSSIGYTETIHLRVNVALPTSEDRLKILYTYNIDEDADDQLEFGFDAVRQDSAGGLTTSSYVTWWMPRGRSKRRTR